MLYGTYITINYEVIFHCTSRSDLTTIPVCGISFLLIIATVSHHTVFLLFFYTYNIVCLSVCLSGLHTLFPVTVVYEILIGVTVARHTERVSTCHHRTYR